MKWTLFLVPILRNVIKCLKTKSAEGVRKVEQADIKAVFENHLKVLENAAQKQCSGEELKAITEAMKITAELID